MKTLTSRFAALVAALSLLPAAFAQDAAKPADAAPAPKAAKVHKAAKAAKAKPAADGVTKAGKPYPFHGTVISVDKNAMTFTPMAVRRSGLQPQENGLSLSRWMEILGPVRSSICQAMSSRQRHPSL